MKKKSGKGLALLVCLILVCTGIVGCGSASNDKNPDTQEETGGGTATEEATATQAPDTEEKATIEILSLKTEEGPQNAFNQMFESFRKAHPNVEFDIQAMSSDELKTTLRARSASGDMPDIITWMKEVEPEYLLDLSGESFISNLNADSVSAANAIYDDGVYAMPVDNGYIGLYYNKDVLEANGLEVPKTVSELKNTCEALKAKGITPFASSLSDLSVPYMSLIALFSETVFGPNPDWSAQMDAGEHTILEDSGWKTAFDLHKEFVYGYSDPDTAYNQSYDDCAALLANGEVAFYGNGSWALSGIRDVNQDANIGLMAFPVSENEQDAKLLCFPDTALSICAGSENIDAAKEFLAYVASEEAGKIWSENVKVSSTVNGVNVDYDPISADINYYLTNNLFTPYGDRVLRSVFTDKLWEIYSYYMLDEYDWDTLAGELDNAWETAIKSQ